MLDLWWARRYDLTESGYLEWIFGHWFELGAAFVSVCVALLVVMFLARWLGEIWWVPGAAAFVAIGAFFAFVQPYLVDTTPLKDPALQRSATEFERKQGVSKIPIRVEDVSGTTSQANAYAVGFGASRRVVLWSTMIDGTFSDAEVRVVLAHEIGHHSSNHIPKGLAWFGLFALPGAWVLMRATRRRGGMGEAAAVPLALLVVAVLQLATRAGAGVDQPADGGRGRLEGASDDARSGGCPRPLRRLRDDLARQPRPACLGARAPRQPSDAGTARRDGGGVEAAQSVDRRDAWLQPGVEREGWTPTATRSTPGSSQASSRYVRVYSGPEPPSGGVRRPPRAVIAPHWTQLDGVSFTSTVPSPSPSPTS